MVQTCGIPERFKIVRLEPTNAIENFNCGDRDLNDYITNRASLFDYHMLAVSYTCIDPDTKQIFGGVTKTVYDHIPTRSHQVRILAPKDNYQ